MIRRDDVTITFEGVEEKVCQRFREELVGGMELTEDDLDQALDELPMPDGDDGLVPADEFYN